MCASGMQWHACKRIAGQQAVDLPLTSRCALVDGTVQLERQSQHWREKPTRATSLHERDHCSKRCLFVSVAKPVRRALVAPGHSPRLHGMAQHAFACSAMTSHQGKLLLCRASVYAVGCVTVLACLQAAILRRLWCLQLCTVGQHYQHTRAGVCIDGAAKYPKHCFIRCWHGPAGLSTARHQLRHCTG